MVVKFTNNARSSLAASITADETSLLIAAGDAGKFPTLGAGDWFPLTLVKPTGEMEIVRVTSRVGAALTVTRAQEATIPRAFDAGTAVSLRPTAGLLAEILGIAQGDHTHEKAQIVGLVADLESIALSLTEINDSFSEIAPVLDSARRGTPIGGLQFMATTTAPPGWISPAGPLLSRTEYPELWAHAQTSGMLAASDSVWSSSGLYGLFSPGDGATTFRAPDLRGLFPRVWDAGRGVDSGRAVGTYQGSQNLLHGHGVNDPGHAHGVADPGHSHGYDGTTSGSGFDAIELGGGPTGASSGRIHGSNTGIGIYGSGTGISIQASGGSEARPGNIALPIYMRAY
ncbi:MAG: hypothetical protein DI528_12850 [Shinella sp.]|nr:MAG: hypothetical protein DI528_12850 [Shinella sp.]